jgi:hypothetical protein
MPLQYQNGAFHEEGLDVQSIPALANGFSLQNISNVPFNAGASEAVICQAPANSTLIKLLRFAANWVLGATNTSVNVVGLFEIQ